MGHRPYPNADRSLRHARRGQIRWVQPARGVTPWLLKPERVDLSSVTVRMPRLPEGWSEKAAANIGAIFAGLRPVRRL